MFKSQWIIIRNAQVINTLAWYVLRKGLSVVKYENRYTVTLRLKYQCFIYNIHGHLRGNLRKYEGVFFKKLLVFLLENWHKISQHSYQK